MFFVATAPSEAGRINLSPKGYRDTFAVLDDHAVGYLDLFGSGVETIAHLRDNGRITLMFCSFTRNSRILRLSGTGRTVPPHDDEFPRLAAHFGDQHPGTRAVIVIDVERIADSCGYAVPYYELVDERPVLDKALGKATDENSPPSSIATSAASTDCRGWSPTTRYLDSPREQSQKPLISA